MTPAIEEIDDQKAARGEELLAPGALYTHGRLAFTCLKHEVGEKPLLKLKLYSASFVESMALLRPFDSFMKNES